MPYKRYRLMIQRGAFQEIKEFDRLEEAIKELFNNKEAWLYELIANFPLENSFDE